MQVAELEWKRGSGNRRLGKMLRDRFRRTVRSVCISVTDTRSSWIARLWAELHLYKQTYLAREKYNQVKRFFNLCHLLGGRKACDRRIRLGVDVLNSTSLTVLR